MKKEEIILKVLGFCQTINCMGFYSTFHYVETYEYLSFTIYSTLEDGTLNESLFNEYVHLYYKNADSLLNNITEFINQHKKLSA